MADEGDPLGKPYTKLKALFFLIYGPIDNMSKLQAETTPSVIVRGGKTGTACKPVGHIA